MYDIQVLSRFWIVFLERLSRGSLIIQSRQLAAASSFGAGVAVYRFVFGAEESFRGQHPPPYLLMDRTVALSVLSCEAACLQAPLPRPIDTRTATVRQPTPSVHLHTKTSRSPQAFFPDLLLTSGGIDTLGEGVEKRFRVFPALRSWLLPCAA